MNDIPNPKDARSVADVDVLIVGSGPSGSTYARVVADARPEASILIVEVGPRLGNVVGEHTANMTADGRAACQLLSQGPDAGVVRASLAGTWRCPIK